MIELKKAERLPDPTGRGSCPAGFFLRVGDRLLRRGGFLLHPVQLGDRSLPVSADNRALGGIVAAHKIAGQRVDAALQCVLENL